MGKVGIGTEHSTEALTVQGNIQVTKIPFILTTIGAILDYNLCKETFRSPKSLLITICAILDHNLCKGTFRSPIPSVHGQHLSTDLSIIITVPIFVRILITMVVVGDRGGFAPERPKNQSSDCSGAWKPAAQEHPECSGHDYDDDYGDTVQ